MIASIWDPLVALGTLGLAAATFALVRVTYRLARQSVTEIRAQWRPVLLIPRQGELIYQHDELLVPVFNDGRGPALQVEAILLGFDLPGSGWGSPSGMEPVPGTMGSRRAVAMAREDTVMFRWAGIGPVREAVDREFRYDDLAGMGFRTRFEVVGSGSKTELRWQTIEEDEPVHVALTWWQRRLPGWALRRMRNSLPPGIDVD